MLYTIVEYLSGIYGSTVLCYVLQNIMFEENRYIEPCSQTFILKKTSPAVADYVWL